MKQEKSHLSIILPDLNGGGAQRMLLNMAIEFCRKGYKVDLIILCASAQETYQTDTTQNLNFHFWNFPKAIFSTPKLIHYFATKRPDFIISALTYINIITIFAKKFSFIPKSKIFVTERAYHSINAKMTVSRYCLEKTLIKVMYPFSDKVVGISKGVTSDIQQIANLKGDNVTTIYNPVITPEFKEKLEEKIEHPFFSNKETIKIISCGRLVEVKDYPTLIKAFSILKKDLNIELGILGKGPLEQQLKNITKEYNIENNVHFLGFSHNTLPYIKQADIFVMTSLSEGFGNVIVEALYCGTPIVSTDCPSGPREILDNGQYGSLVPVKSPEALASAIKDTLLSPPDSNFLQERAKSFNVSKTCDEFEKLFKEKLGHLK